MLLPCDGISTLQSLSWWEECDFGNQFKAVIKMPLNSLVPEKIVVSFWKLEVYIM